MRRIFIGVLVFVGLSGILYLATLGCCQLMTFPKAGAKPIPLSEQLHLTPTQRQAVAPLEKSFLAQRQASCQTLCAKRAQLIQSLKQANPDRATLGSLVEEIGQEQMILEKATLDHLLALRGSLDPTQQERLMVLITEELRTACKNTACGMTPGCAMKEVSN